MEEPGHLAGQRRIARGVVAHAIELIGEAAEVVDELRFRDGVHARAAARLPVRRDDDHCPRAVQTLAETAVGPGDGAVLDGECRRPVCEKEGRRPDHLRIIPRCISGPC